MHLLFCYPSIIELEAPAEPASWCLYLRPLAVNYKMILPFLPFLLRFFDLITVQLRPSLLVTRCRREYVIHLGFTGSYLNRAIPVVRPG